MRTTIDIDSDVEELLKTFLHEHKRFNCHTKKSEVINNACRQVIPSLIEHLKYGKDKDWVLNCIKHLQSSLTTIKDVDQRIELISKLGRIQLSAYANGYITKIQPLPDLVVL